MPENLVGAILGKGKTLVEYQELTGARIQISEGQGSGTRNRRVTIRGQPRGGRKPLNTSSASGSPTSRVRPPKPTQRKWD